MRDKDTTDRMDSATVYGYLAAGRVEQVTVAELLTAAAELCVEADRRMHEDAETLPESYQYRATMPDGSKLLHPAVLGWQLTEHARRYAIHLAEQPIPKIRPLDTKLRRLSIPYEDLDDALDDALAGAYGPPGSGGAA